MLPRKQAV